MQVVIVESPAKAKTINKYLGSDFQVFASYGHIRDLPAKDGSVKPDDGFAMIWEVDGKAEKHLKEIAAALKNATALYLATDPDREGEAISWHVKEELLARKKLKDIDIKRVVFNEITQSAVSRGIANPRDLDSHLIEAYLARRALDYLVGFTLSPVLWRKLPGSRSAGRVQSVTLRLVCERESEIENFVPREYWSAEATFATPKGELYEARLTRLDGEKLDRFALGDQGAADAVKSRIEQAAFKVGAVDRKRARRNPAPPFTTSTLQQESARKLGYSAKRTMQLAQRLYEDGLITYMRTDGVQMAEEAISAVRARIETEHGRAYRPDTPRIYKTRAKNAQEAHEAIRPTDFDRTPGDVAQKRDRDEARLYELVYKRTLASQMQSAEFDQVGVDIVSADGNIVLRATGQILIFDGFLKIYREGQDDIEEKDDEKRLPEIADGEAAERRDVRIEQHFTQPPPRYTEASLVKQMEELGIGRPSTYASILSVLQDRDYVRLDSRRFVPEDRGRVVIAFLENFFGRYVEYDFTARLEETLDDISGGRANWQAVLTEFWRDFRKAVDDTKDLTIGQVLDALDQELGPHFFPHVEGKGDPRACPACDDGRLSLKIGKFGAFIGCSNYPECRHTRPLVVIQDGETGAEAGDAGDRALGQDPETGQTVWVKKGPYGWYVQLGETPKAPVAAKGKKKSESDAVPKPKRVSLISGMDPLTIDLETALNLLRLPREIGLHPETGAPIKAGIGRFGPYVNVADIYKSLPKGESVFDIGINRAVDLLAPALELAKKSRTLGKHPKSKKPVVVKAGRYGPYAQSGTVRATLPKALREKFDATPEDLSLEEVLPLIDAKSGKVGKSGAANSPAKKSAAKKSAEVS